ncbi:acyl carrier protein [Porcincola intestinalis]|jgi:acyl carrier protein|uniref:Acyl carrier protein n=1 Tax=Porcincola intestinalis TaxID=2606632 RepID=A0A6L5X7Y5_9FIRM|nr:phosphopantetheine-binding protein [Porcincola intestinalis]MCI6699738.1 phosphopantetheine-binding protein [Lachnospiraceae bacterium]MCI6767367.1 phosphopantetheine-binding protein [Lachnospiraceae bacterium]MDD7059843.1 phosphopantetheine-binding protein [Porcincola intestinalis]MDY4205215.1 phosphopantetheine-binding protein [Porcincola intestinalis]MDY5283087.1 phosphopantetheine-binding protein [Porcincola intestinalis]
MKDRILNILKSMDDSVDYVSETKLIDDKVIDSLTLTALISELESEFNIEIDMDDIVPENFNSVDAMTELVERLQDEQ